MSKPAAIVLARMDSSRLPGKPLLDIGGMTLIDLVLRRVSHSDKATVVLATTDRGVDDPLAFHAEEQGVEVVRGPCDDVAGRFLQAGHEVGAAILARINGDSPFLDASLLDAGLALIENTGCDFVTNIPGRTFPYGVAVEVIRLELLERLHTTLDPADREHVTRYLYREMTSCDTRTMTSDRDDLAGVRMTVDTEEDLEITRAAIADLGPHVVTAGWMEAAEAVRRVTAARS